MGLRDRVDAALKEAMRSKDKLRLSTLRLINAAIKDKEISLRGGDASASGLSEDDLLALLGKMVKQRKESVRAYEEGGRLELAEREQAEIGVIEEFLPRKLDDVEVEAAIADAITSVGAEGIRDMGRVMGELKSKFTGQMDFGKVGPMVKDRLG